MDVDFIPFSDEALRISANLAQRHDAWVSAVRQLEEMPSTMYFVKRDGGREYLIAKRNTRDSGVSLGPRDEQAERRLATYLVDRDAVQRAEAESAKGLAEIVAQYRALKLPQAMPIPGRILRELDIANLLGTDLMVVGTNAFAAYQIEAGARFTNASDETEDFDLAWCRGTEVSLARVGAETPHLLEVLRRVDPSFRINPKRPYQAVDERGYPVELLVAPSLFRTLPSNDAFSPMAVFPEQEWLLRGRPVRHVVASRDGRSCPIFAPDPRWMGLHKLWLAQKPERNAAKRPKDLRQGQLLMKAVAQRLTIAYPMDLGFVLDLPADLREVFDAWAHDNGFHPSKDVTPIMR